MKKLLMIFTMLIAVSVFAALPDGGPYKETVDGVEWTFTVSGSEAMVGCNRAKVSEDTGFRPIMMAIQVTTMGAIVIPSSLGGCPVTSIGDEAFAFCDRLTSVAIPSSVTSIGELAFEVCTGLTSVRIPASVRSIGCGAFGYCYRLTSIDVEKNNANYSSQDGVLFNKSKTELLGFPGGKNGAYFVIPSGVTSIGDYAFAGCNGLASVTIPISVMSIGDEAFSECSGVTSVRIPASVRSIGCGAFGYCDRLTSVTIPASVTSIGRGAFRSCGALRTFYVEKNNVHYSSQDGVLFNKSKTELLGFPGGKSGAYFVIPSGVTSIGDYAFAGCNGLTSVTIPAGVTSIGELAFFNCSGLTSVTIPANVTSIGEWAFFNCSGLTSVTIPSSVTSIGELAFYRCEALKTVYVAKGDTQRVKNMLEASSFDTSKVTFVENLDPTPGPTPTPTPEPEPEEEEAFETAHTFGGLVKDEFGMCGMIQVATARKDKKGNVKVSGFVMLEDGKKQTLKAVSGKVSGGAVEVATKAGKTSLSLTITDDGFTGTLGGMAVASADIGEETGIISGTLKMSYFDAKTNKIKTKNITIKGLADGGVAEGTATVKGQGEKSFTAEIVE